MNYAQSLEALKVTDIDRQQLRYSVNIHARGQTGVVNLHPDDFVRDEKAPPKVMHVAAVRQEVEVPLDHASDAIRLINAQSKAVLVERTGGSIQNSPRVCDVKQSRAPRATLAARGKK
jgi:hypothetical protein